MDIFKRRLELAQLTDIPDMAAYALEWEKLAAEFDAVGMYCNGDLCRTKAAEYAALPAGHWTRRVDDPIRILEKVG